MKISKNEICVSRGYRVSQANEFIETRRFLSEQEQDIIMIFISKIKPTDKENPYTTVTLDEFFGLLGWQVGRSAGGKTYRMLENAMKTLADKSAWVDVDNGRALIRWFDEVYFTTKSISVRFNKRLQPFLVGLTEKFTQAALINYLALKSMYAKRLYELLKKGIKQEPKKAYRLTFKEYEITALRDLLYVKEGLYPNFTNFKKNVLDKPIAQINAVTDLDIVGFEPNRSRAPTHITFKIKMKEPAERLKSETNAQNILDGQMTLDEEPEQTVGVKCARCGTINKAEYVNGAIRCNGCDSLIYEPLGADEEEDEDFEDMEAEMLSEDIAAPPPKNEKAVDYSIHTNYLREAKQKGYKIGWAYNRAKEKNASLLPKAEQQKIFDECEFDINSKSPRLAAKIK